MFFTKFPSTKLQDVNLDWLLKKICKLRGGTTNQVLAKASDSDFDFKWVTGGGGGGTSDYNDLVNQPKINNVTLVGNVSGADLGLLEATALANYRTAAAQDAIDAGKQAKITASGMLKGDGNGGVTAATAGSDYLAPSALMQYRTASAQDLIDAGKEAAGLGLTGAVVGDFVRVNAVDTNGKPTSWNHVPLCEIKTNPNLLDNWYFVGGGSQQGGGQFPINQRGQTSYPNPGYTIDRWMTTGGTIQVQNGVNLGVTAIYQGLIQRIENGVSKLGGKTVTFSILYNDNNLFTKTALFPATGANWVDTIGNTGFYVEFYSDSNTGISEVHVVSNQNSEHSITLLAMKLELGSEQTLAHQENGQWVLNEIPDYGEELARCLRYFYKAARCLFMRSGSTNSWVVDSGFKVDMRTAPTFQLIGSYGLIPGISGQAVPTFLSSVYVTKDGFGDVDMTVSPDGTFFCTDATFSADL